MMRLFIAAFPPEELLSALPLEVLKENLTRQGVRFARPDRIHLTLSFLGNVREEYVPELVASIRKNLDGVAAVSLTVNGIGSFPNPQRPGVIYVQCDGDLAELTEKVEQGTREFAETSDSKKLIPHLTLVRISPPSQKVGRALVPLTAELATKTYGKWQVNNLALVQTMADGSYTIIETFQLLEDNREA